MNDCIPLFIHNGLWKGYFIQRFIDVSSCEFDLTYFVFHVFLVIVIVIVIIVEEGVDHLPAKIVGSSIVIGVLVFIGKGGDACGEVECCAKEPNAN